jgi:16S rRNA (guanine966-N2)-methyltransferase
MRVIAGRLGGRVLRAPRNHVTRPTGALVREALFALLGDIGGARVLDLFAGSGALGIEALSRGAREVLFVERDRRAFGALLSNLRALGLQPPQARALRGEALWALHNARRGREKYDLILIDPPYAQGQRWEPRLRLLLPELLCARGRVAVESDRRQPLELALPLVIERRYGHTLVRIHEASREMAAAEDHPEAQTQPAPGTVREGQKRP